MKLKEVLESSTGLSELSGMKLPIKTSYRISRLLRQIVPLQEDYQKAMKELYESLGKVAGEEVKIPKENEAVFLAARNELWEEEVNLEFQPLTLDDFGDEMPTPYTLYVLSWLVKETA